MKLYVGIVDLHHNQPFVLKQNSVWVCRCRYYPSSLSCKNGGSGNTRAPEPISYIEHAMIDRIVKRGRRLNRSTREPLTLQTVYLQPSKLHHMLFNTISTLFNWSKRQAAISSEGRERLLHPFSPKILLVLGNKYQLV